MIIRRQRHDDATAVARVHDAAFSPVDAPGPTAESWLVEELWHDGDALPPLSLVALEGDDVVGHVMCSRGHVEHRPQVALGPVGVRPARQRAGVGTALMHAVLGAADALDEPAVFLLGDPAYYRRFGFVPAATQGVEPPDAAWGIHFQVRTLTTWDPACSGDFRYPSAFARI